MDVHRMAQQLMMLAQVVPAVCDSTPPPSCSCLQQHHHPGYLCDQDHGGRAQGTAQGRAGGVCLDGLDGHPTPQAGAMVVEGRERPGTGGAAAGYSAICRARQDAG